jgi:hypothetical protein
MKSFAVDPDMSARLYAASLGSIAWRVPAKDGIARRIETYVTIVALAGSSMGRPATSLAALRNSVTYVEARGDFDALDGLSVNCATVQASLAGDAAANMRDAGGAAPAGGGPAPLGPFTDRAKNRRHRYAVDAAEIECKAASEAVAFAYGYYRATCEATGVNNAYRNAPSVVSLCEDWGTTVAAGITLHGDRIRWARINPAAVIPSAPIHDVSPPLFAGVAAPALAAP